MELFSIRIRRTFQLVSTQQAKVATNIIADMITFYRNNLKADNNDTYIKK